MNQKIRMGIGIILIAVIIVMSSLIYKNKEKYFKYEVNVTYFDGCIETFVDGEMVTVECTESRAKAELIKNERTFQIDPDMIINFTI